MQLGLYVEAKLHGTNSQLPPRLSRDSTTAPETCTIHGFTPRKWLSMTATQHLWRRRELAYGSWLLMLYARGQQRALNVARISACVQNFKF